jgi:hypothetical protein
LKMEVDAESLGWVFPDVSRDRTAFIFWVKQFRKTSGTERQSVLLCAPKDTASHPTRLEHSVSILIKIKRNIKNTSHF